MVGMGVLGPGAGSCKGMGSHEGLGEVHGDGWGGSQVSGESVEISAEWRGAWNLDS